MATTAVRAFDPASDADSRAAWRLRAVAFGGDRGPGDPAPGWTEGWRGWLAGDPAVGFARAWPFRQFWGGAAVPCAGVASVAVAPHARGHGVASAVLRVALPAMREAGQPISALFPATPPLYRRHGWEHVGVYESVDVPTLALHADVRAVPRPTGVTLRDATAADLPALLACHRAQAADVDGLLDQDDLAHVLDADVATVAVDSEDRGDGTGGAIRGFLHASRGEPGLVVRDLVAHDQDATVALLGSLASWAGSLADVRIRLGRPLALLPASFPSALSSELWMLRVVDLPAAVAARGWPATRVLPSGVAVEVDVVDEHAPWHAGRWRLAVVEPGRVTCERAGSAPAGADVVTLSARGLAAWYAGTRSSSLRRAGLLTGGRADVLDALTGARGQARITHSF